MASAALEVASFFAALGAEAAALDVACSLDFWLLALAVLAAPCTTPMWHVGPGILSFLRLDIVQLRS